MSHNAGSCKVVRFKAVPAVDSDVQEFAEDFFDVVSLDYNDDGSEQLVGYMRDDADIGEMETAARKAGVNLPDYTAEILSSDDWLADNVIEFKPVETECFLVYGIHEKHIDLKDKIGVRVYAATAFGSEHQTTRCCLQGIADINKLLQPQKVLDMGTGSGVLAIAAAKLWPTARFVAVDIDDESVRVAAQNAKDNGVDSRIMTVLGDGYAAAQVPANAPYDVILANILARPLIAMTDDMAKNLRIGGYAVISGYIDNQEDWVVGEHEKHGLKLIKEYADDNWRAALLKKE